MNLIINLSIRSWLAELVVERRGSCIDFNRFKPVLFCTM